MSASAAEACQQFTQDIRALILFRAEELNTALQVLQIPPNPLKYQELMLVHRGLG